MTDPTTYSGWEGVVYHHWNVSQENVGSLSGAGAAQNLSSDYPMCNGLTMPTLTLTDADITVRNLTAGANLVATTDYTINTSSMSINIKAAYNAGNKSGNVIVISYTARKYMAYAHQMSFKVDSKVEALHCFGSRNPAILKDGPIEVSGKIGQLFTNDSILCDCVNRGGALPYATLEYWPLSNESFRFMATELKFKSWKTDVGEKVMGEECDFVAKSQYLKL